MVERFNNASFGKAKKMNFTQNSFFFRTEDSTPSEQEEEKSSSGYETRTSTSCTPIKAKHGTIKLLGSLYTSSRLQTTLITEITSATSEDEEEERQRMYETQVFAQADKSAKRAREASARAGAICTKMNETITECQEMLKSPQAQHMIISFRKSHRRYNSMI